MLPIEVSAPSLERLLSSGLIEFLDLGCGVGGSYQYARRYTDMKTGLSLDLSSEKIIQCRTVNDLSFVFDVGKLPMVPNCVSSAFCMHFLEHIDDAATVFQIIETAVTATRDFLFVRQPYFDHDAALAALGCKTYWSDWSGHKTKLTRDMVAELSGRLGEAGLSCEVSVYAMDRIDSTGHSAVLPLGVPPDQHAYDPERHGEKPIAVIDFDCFRDILIVFARDTITGNGHQRMQQLLASLGSRTTLLGEFHADRRRGGQPMTAVA